MASHAIEDAFETSKTEFLSQFTNGPPANFEEFATINDVYKAAEEIQSTQAKKRTTRNLRKIQPFLECLRHYGEVIETLVTVNSGLLALIWGPIKFLLLTSSTYLKSFDKLVDAMAQIGLSLPAFEKYTALFPDNQPIQQVLCLFYQDILDFYSTVLVFFKHKRWSVFFESLWPKSAGRIQVIIDNIEKHRILMDGSITLAHVVEAHAMRQRAFEEFERQHDFRQSQDLKAVESSLGPVLYDRELERLKTSRWMVRPGDWLLEQERYTKWIDESDKTTRLLWLQGIPGSGKTFLSSSIIESIAAEGKTMVFAFLNYQSQERFSTLQLLHSFVLQMALDHKMLQAPLILAHQEDYRRFNSDLGFIKDLFCQFVDLMPTMFIVIDGLDEILPSERFQLLRIFLDILRDKGNVKILVSCRPEDDIARTISLEAQPLRVHDCNSLDIEAYVDRRASSLVSDVNLFDSSLADEILRLVKAVASKAEGMFLYARLVCDSISMLGDIDSIKQAIDDLPDGLNEAYERILCRITDGLEKCQREETRQILALITCCVVPLSKNEILLAVYTAQGRNPSKGCKGLFLNILNRCGPIIEEIDGHFRFVHFSAREYLLSHQSKNYLTKSAAHEGIALMCIKYLNSSCFDVNIDDCMIHARIQSGAFVLLDYVCSHWLHHIENCGIQASQELINDLGCLIEGRSNPWFVDEVAVSDFQYGMGFQFSRSIEKMKRKLDDARAFSKKRKRDLSFDDGKEWGPLATSFESQSIDMDAANENWKHMDPFTFSQTEARFRQWLDSMLCGTSNHLPDCSCQQLKSIYGSSIYKCGWPGCNLSRVGFDTAAQRNEHVRKHTRPYKCQIQNCPYAEFGFATTNQLAAHSTQAHEERPSIATTGLKELSSKEMIKAIMIDAVKENDLSTIREMEAEVKKFTLSLLLTAYQERSSEAMIQHLLETFPVNSFRHVDSEDLESMMSLIDKIFEASVRHGNYDVFWGPNELLTFWKLHTRERTDAQRQEPFRLIGSTRCADLIAAISFAENKLEPPDHVVSSSGEFSAMLLFVTPAQSNAQIELLALECLSRVKLHRYFQQEATQIFSRLGSTSYSIPIAEFLLANGAKIDEPSGLRMHKQAPIVQAARNVTSRQSAKFLEFLVRKGATTSGVITSKGKALHELSGPRKIQKWIGITWDELVRQSTLPDKADET